MGARHSRRVVASAPRIDLRLVRVARRLARRTSSTADVHRSVGAYAARIGVIRPSYEQIRLVVNKARILKERRRATVQLLLDVHQQRRPVADLKLLLED